MEWFFAVIKARSALEKNERGSVARSLDEAIGLTKKYANIAGALPQQIFSFMKDPGLKRVAEEDWNRAVGAAQREEAKTTAVAAGSVVEAIAIDILERLDKNQIMKMRNHLNQLKKEQRRGIDQPPKPTPKEWKFAFQLLALGPAGLKILDKRTHDIGDQLRNWRNCVHPDKYRSEEPLSSADGRLAIGFAEKVIEQVRTWDNDGAKLKVPGQ